MLAPPGKGRERVGEPWLHGSCLDEDNVRGLEERIHLRTSNLFRGMSTLQVSESFSLFCCVSPRHDFSGSMIDGSAASSITRRIRILSPFFTLTITAEKEMLAWYRILRWDYMVIHSFSQAHFVRNDTRIRIVALKVLDYAKISDQGFSGLGMIWFFFSPSHLFSSTQITPYSTQISIITPSELCQARYHYYLWVFNVVEPLGTSLYPYIELAVA